MGSEINYFHQDFVIKQRVEPSNTNNNSNENNLNITNTSNVKKKIAHIHIEIHNDVGLLLRKGEETRK